MIPVRLEGVGFRYARSDVDVLTDVSLSLPGGGITCITGRLGAGASTLLLAVAGLAPRTTGGHRSGRITTLDVDPSTTDGARQIRGRAGVLLPTPWTQLSGMTYVVRDEVAFGPANLGWESGRIGTTVERSMELLDITRLADRDPATLSGGEMQRTVLAGLLAMEPDLLLLDEPDLELDPAAADRLYKLLAELALTTTIIVATTDQDRIAESADRVIVLDHGRVVGDGVPAEVLGQPITVSAGSSSSIGALFAGLGDRVPVTVDEAERWLAT